MTYGLTWQELQVYAPKNGEFCYAKCGGQLMFLHKHACTLHEETVYECNKCCKKVTVKKYLTGVAE